MKHPIASFTVGDRVFKQCEGCRANGRARFKRAYDADPQRFIDAAKDWRKENPEKAKAAKQARERRYWQRNPHKKAAKNREYSQRHPQKRLAHVRARQAMKANQMPKWADRAAIEAVYDKAKQLRAQGLDVHVDHIEPLKGKHVCGLHVADNLQIVPAAYNVRKHNKAKPDKIA